jgi:hypothetical protein
MEAYLFVIKWCARGLPGAHGSSGFVPKPALATPSLFAASSAQRWRVITQVWSSAADFPVLWNPRPTDHSSRTRFVAAMLYPAS